MSVTEELFALLQRPIFDSDRARARTLLLDWTACAVAGRAEPVGQKLATALPAGPGPCSRIGNPPASVQMATYHNGSLGNVLEMDDVDRRAVLHAAPTVIPSALAMAQHVGAGPQSMLDAIVIGYEATIRIGRAVGPGHYAFWHNTATCGPFGAAAAAVSLLGGADMVAALGLAGTQAAGLWQTRHEPDSDAKQIHAGHAAQVGVQSAFLSAQGIRGPRSILEGEQGFFRAMCPGADASDVLTDPDASWCLHDTSLKPYPACRHAHPAIDAALLAREAGFFGEGEILVETYEDALKFCDRPDPQTLIEAKFSLQHSVAHTLSNGVPGLADFDAAAVKATRKIRNRVSLHTHPEFQSTYPAHYGAAVTVGGRRFGVTDALGDPERPLTDARLHDKAMELMMSGGMNARAAEHFVTVIDTFGDHTTLADYADSLPSGIS